MKSIILLLVVFLFACNERKTNSKFSNGDDVDVTKDTVCDVVMMTE